MILHYFFMEWIFQTAVGKIKIFKIVYRGPKVHCWYLQQNYF